MPAQTFIEELNVCSECLVTLRERVFVDGPFRRVARTRGESGKRNEVSVMTHASAAKNRAKLLVRRLKFKMSDIIVINIIFLFSFFLTLSQSNTASKLETAEWQQVPDINAKRLFEEKKKE